MSGMKWNLNDALGCDAVYPLTLDGSKGDKARREPRPTGVAEGKQFLSANVGYEFICQLGGGAHLRKRGGGGRFLVGVPSRLAVDGVGGGGEQRGFGIGDDQLAHRSADAGTNQAAGAVAVFELPEHDQAMAERADGAGIKGTMMS